MERYESVLENCMSCPSVRAGDVTFATRFVAAYMFLKVSGYCPMSYQHLTLRMFESGKRNEGMVNQKIGLIVCILTNAAWYNGKIYKLHQTPSHTNLRVRVSQL